MKEEANPNLRPDYTPDDVKVGQIWECIEDRRQIILISLVRPKEIRGYIFTGFEVAPFYSFSIYDFCKYWRLYRERK